MADDELTFTVSAKDIYDAVKSLEAAVQALPTTDHETRIRTLERWRYAAGGGLALGLADAIRYFVQMKGG